ncbi:MAG: globin [Caldilineaceae bacterium]|nr:globin [Caldilineaceae bacterium]
MEELTSKELFLQSVDRCVATEAFISTFYERFLGASDEIKNKFRFTNFRIQSEMLRRSLVLCAGVTTGNPESMSEVKQRAVTHDRSHLNIKPQLYEIWLETIIDTARDYDDQWDETTEAAWQRILGHVINYMVRKY